MTEAEIWKSCAGYEGSYEVSNFGRVRSLPRMVPTGLGAQRLQSGGVLDGDSNGRYRRVNLCSNGEATSFTVHRLVAAAFLENPQNYPVVNHKDGDTFNNCAANLEWCSHQQNIVHRFEVLKKGLRPILVFNKSIGFWYPSQVRAAQDLGGNGSTISHVLSGRQKRTRGYFVEYSNCGGVA